jgi:hypothetical protein
VCGSGQVGDNIASEAGTVITLLFPSETLKFHYFFNIPLQIIPTIHIQNVMSSYSHANITKKNREIGFKTV